MLQYCLRKGLKLKKMQRLISAEESNFMKSYISLNNEKRTECLINQDKICVQSFKLMTNANGGKQIENVRKYKDIRITNNVDKAEKIATKLTLNEWHILSENVTLHEMKKHSALLDKPIIIGFTILEIAKLHVDIHYDRLQEIVVIICDYYTLTLIVLNY